MKPLAWMVGASVGSWLAIAVWSGVSSSREVLFGMLAPLAGAASTWVLVARNFTSRPELVTPLMVAAFAGKLVFFGAYVGMAIGVMHVQPIPFIVSFTAYFIALHLIEALCMKRMFVS
jgi:hypothetical protein